MGDSKAEVILKALSTHLHCIETLSGSNVRSIIPTYTEALDNDYGIDITFNLEGTPLKVLTHMRYIQRGDNTYQCTILNTEDRQEVQFTDTCKPVVSSYSTSFLGVFTQLGVGLEDVERFIHYIHGATVSIASELLKRWVHIIDLVDNGWHLLPNETDITKEWERNKHPITYNIDLMQVDDMGSTYELNGYAHIQYEGDTIQLAYKREEVCLYDIDTKKPSPTRRLAVELELDATHYLKGLMDHINYGQ